MNPLDYKSAGVDMDAASEAIGRVTDKIRATFKPHVLTDVGSFGAMVDLEMILKNYRHPVLVQSIDGVGTKMIVAGMMEKYDTIGMDLVSATCNDIIVHGARPVTFLDYIASDTLEPDVIEAIVSGIVEACKASELPLLGGETAEMPDTYLSGEHDLVGVVTGIVEKDRIVTGEKIERGDRVFGLGSSGLHTNGYSLARKVFFDQGKFTVDSTHPGLEKTVGETLLEPHLNYSEPVLRLLKQGLSVRGMAHITGGGLIDNLPRILPPGCAVHIHRNAWPTPPVFKILRELGPVEELDMFRTFNMGIGLVMIVSPEEVDSISDFFSHETVPPLYEIGTVIQGDRTVSLGS